MQNSERKAGDSTVRNDVGKYIGIRSVHFIPYRQQPLAWEVKIMRTEDDCPRWLQKISKYGVFRG